MLSCCPPSPPPHTHIHATCCPVTPPPPQGRREALGFKNMAASARHAGGLRFYDTHNSYAVGRGGGGDRGLGLHLYDTQQRWVCMWVCGGDNTRYSFAVGWEGGGAARHTTAMQWAGRGGGGDGLRG